jgi:hypothetical protein
LGYNSSRRRVPVKWCTQDDFGTDETDKKFFNSWVGFSIVCPDFSSGTMFNFFNDGLYVKYSTLNLIIDKCNSSLYDFCKSEEEINQFLSDFWV